MEEGHSLGWSSARSQWSVSHTDGSIRAYQSPEAERRVERRKRGLEGKQVIWHRGRIPSATVLKLCMFDLLASALSLFFDP